MIDLIDNRTLMIVGCTALVLVGLVGVRWAMIPARREEARRRQLMAVNEVTRDWRVTWKINAVTDAWVMAIWRRGKPDALLHHSDRGSQYTSEQFQKLMAGHGVICSMSRSGNVWDNAAMESFFSSLKTERTARKTYRMRDEAKADEPGIRTQIEK
jgi:transposase InsO family protein